jgi:hypothetical protein
MTTVSTPAPGAPDWTLIEADYRAGVKSVRTIAEEHGISHTAIGKRAKRDKWERDLAPKIQARADAKVARAAVSSDVAAATKAAEAVVVEVNATLQYQVRMDHRRDIGEARQLWSSLLGELKATGITREQIEQLLATMPEAMTSRQRDDARQILVRLTGVGARIGNFNTLVHALERLVKLERQAFGIAGGDGEEGDNPAHPAAAAAAGHGRGLSDAERAIRLARLLKMQPGLAAALPGAAVAPAGADAAPAAPATSAVPVPPGRE